MVKIEQTFSVTSSSSYFITNQVPSEPLSKIHSIIRITSDDGVSISSIEITLNYGLESNEVFTYKFINPEICPALCVKGSTLLDKICSIIQDLDRSDRHNILNAFNIKSHHDDDQILVNIFVSSLATYLSVIALMLQDQPSLKFPFSPFQSFTFPFDSVDTSFLTRSHFDYFSHLTRFLISINSSSIGRIWSQQLTNFWNIFGSCFHRGHHIDPSSIIYQTILGFSTFINSPKDTNDSVSVSVDSLDTIKHTTIDEIESFKSEALTSIETAKDDALSEIDDFKSQFVSHLDHDLPISLKSTIHSLAEDSVSAQAELILNNLASKHISSCLEDSLKSIQNAGSLVLSNLELLKSDLPSSDSSQLSNVESRLSHLESQVATLTDLTHKIALCLRLRA